MRGKKIASFLLCILVGTSGIVLIPKNSDVRADGYQNTSGENEIGLNTTYVWELVKRFGNVTFDADWSEENNIPKGRSWATAGENYTIDNILINEWRNFTNPAFDEYQKLLIGPIDKEPYKDRLYSNKIVIKDFDLTIENPEKIIPNSEMFPIGIGWSEDNILNHTYGFYNVDILEKNLFANDFLGESFFPNRLNVSVQFLNSDTLFGGSPVYLSQDDPVPEDQDGLVFIMNETEDCEDKLDNITDASACILIKGNSFYSYEQADEKQFSILRVDETDDNLSEILLKMENGSEFFVDNLYDSNRLVFTNLSDVTCIPEGLIWVFVIQRTAPSDPRSRELRVVENYLGSLNGYYYDFYRLQLSHKFWYRVHEIWGITRGCLGYILSDYTNTHFMTHTVKGWNWFSDAYSDRWWLPTFSVNKSIGDFLLEHHNTVKVTGSIEQEYRCQTTTEPGVISHNFIGYRNITQDETAPVTILSNRIDGWWGATTGDSGAGGAILLGIAKYFNDYNIIPKCNLRFLFTTGEEYGMRGAQHYNDSHPHNATILYDNITRWIGLDQLGFYFTTSDDTINLTVNILDNTTKAVIKTIANDTQYVDRTGYGIWVDQPDGYGSEDKVFKTRENCSTICFGKDNTSRWDGYHRSGEDYYEGDSLNHTDRNDVNVTFELIWNVTKYYVVNPDCEIDGTALFIRTDSPNDEDEDVDTIEATIPIKSILPQDKIRVKAVLKNLLGFQVASETRDYVIGNSTSNFTINVTLPPGRLLGLYKLWLYLYNSTGRINQILSISPNGPNDTTNSDFLFLYPRGNQAPTTPTQPLGPTSLKRGELGSWSALTYDPNNDLVGQKWYMYYDTWPYTPQYDTGLYDPESLSLFIMHRYWTLGTYQIRVKAYDEYSTLLHPYESEPSPYLTVEVTPWCDIIEQQTHQEGLIHVVEGLPFQFYGELSGGENHVFEWNFNDHTRCSTMQNPEHTYSDSGMYNVTFNVTDETTQLIGRTYTLVRVSDLDSNFNMNYYQGAAPETIITFWNTSKAKNGNSITNVTWDFDDGTISYANIVNHTFETDGDYNVTLTVKDSANNTDVDYAILHISSNPEPPEIPYVQSPGVLPPDSEATILAEIVPTDRNLSSVSVNITTPNGTMGNYTMTEIIDNVYIYTLDNISQNGQFNFTIWVTDIENNTNSSTGNFTMIVPLLSFETPTPSNYAIRNHNWVNVNVTVP